jgi:hypothetical protein
MPKYRLRYFFDPGAGICLWTANEDAERRFGYAVDASKLPLLENTWRRVLHLCHWYDTSIDWNHPPDPSPWDAIECKRFNDEAQKLLAELRGQLGPDFELVDESETDSATQ